MKPPSLFPLRAGPLKMFWEPGGLRYVRLGQREIIRRIYGAVRDRNWGTVPGELSDVHIEKDDESFHITFNSLHRQNETDFVWRGEVHGTANGVIRFTFDGRAHTTFLRNRIGLCILHPTPECAGARTRQTRPGGQIVDGRFPQLIEPQIVGGYSHRDLRALSHEVHEDVWCDVQFDGETFETEDQRNWTDASFKTYGTPLALPFPVEVAAQTRIRQVIGVSLHGGLTPLHVEVAGDDAVEIGIERAVFGPLPELGISQASHGHPLTSAEIGPLKAMQPSHLRTDLKLDSPRWTDELERAIRDAAALETQLEVALFLPANPDGELHQLRDRLNAAGARLARFMVFRKGLAATDPQAVQLAREHLGCFSVPVGSGTDANFCELNREQHLGRAAIRESDFVCWSANPQVHADDLWSISECAGALAATVQTARAFADGRPLIVSPVTLKQRWNPVATGADRRATPGELPPEVDPRQLSAFAGAWTLAAMKHLAESRVKAATFYETSGWRGVMETPRGSPLPERFPSRAGAAFPLYFPLRDIRTAPRSSRWVGSRSTRPLDVETFAILDDERLSVYLANLTDAAQRVRIAGWRGAARWRGLEPETTASFCEAPEQWAAQRGKIVTPTGNAMELVIPPHAYGCLRPGD
ncbi:MAG TPA: hypothetical protein DCY13_16435 [Verrucomicrobiales bacterium]|nr:hypothetical protein [Verrucomicrobiales bacterium]